MKNQTYAENRKAHFEYEILETIEAGLSLLGTEVKSIQAGRVNLTGSFVILRGNIPYLVGVDIPAYQPKNAPKDYDPLRSRPLLLNQKEIQRLRKESNEQKLTLLPLSVYNKNNLIKVEIALAHRRKKSDKREAIKKREVKREIGRVMK